MKKPKFSIIICLYVIIPRFFEDLQKFKKLKGDNFEIIIVADKKIDVPDLGLPISLVLTGKDRTGVGEKRDVALKHAKGDFIAYIDDDAYPDPHWLEKALPLFDDSQVGAVGGPNITPPEDPFWAQVGGLIYESYFASGGAQYRFIPQPRREVHELQGVNLIIRKTVLDKIGGFSTKLFSGDDTKICYSIRLLGYKVIYDPQVAVYHHRRPFPKLHLRQLRTMATHRGYFVKRYPETSQYPIYFLPSAFVIFLILLLLLSIFLPIFWIIFVGTILLVVLAGMLSVINRGGVLKSFCAGIGVLVTHLTYGIYFLKGLFLVKNLENR